MTGDKKTLDEPLILLARPYTPPSTVQAFCDICQILTCLVKFEGCPHRPISLYFFLLYFQIRPFCQKNISMIFLHACQCQKVVQKMRFKIPPTKKNQLNQINKWISSTSVFTQNFCELQIKQKYFFSATRRSLFANLIVIYRICRRR